MSQFLFNSFDDDTPPDDGLWNPRHQTPRDLFQQLAISVLLGLSAFTSFCLIRPKWPQFYSARKIQVRNASSSLPDLPSNMLGWIPALWRINDQDILETAGLDAYVFLSFFKMAIKFLFVSSILALVVLVPIHSYFGEGGFFEEVTQHVFGFNVPQADDKKPLIPIQPDPNYLWANLVFVYVFTGLAYYFLWDQTREIVEVRQNYLGGQSTLTDRTIKLSGIPEELRSEGFLKEYIEKLRIGKVEKITICREWEELDVLLAKRRKTLRKLEEVHTVYQTTKNRRPGQLAGLPYLEPAIESNHNSHEDDEAQPLLEGAPSRPVNSGRPQLHMRYGRFKLKFRKVDAIDYFTMKLQELDDKITEARRKEYRATPLAFVTMDSVSSAQIAMQTLLDPIPGAMIARQAPSPSDVVWKHTYLSRSARLIRVWSISIIVSLVSIFWLIPVAALAGLWNMGEIRRIWPDLADKLEQNEALASLIQNFLPTLFLTLLNVAVPYFYDWLSQYQGMISQEDIELSIVSKNFFFTFFNLFLAFTIWGTAFTFRSFWDVVKGSFSDTKTIALLLAKAVEDLGPFYVNLIILQGLGMFPLRLLQIGTVSMYPVNKFGAKTPRDFAELVEPPVFQYGFFLPQPILIFIICIVYSVLERGVLILSFGLVYFLLGYFTYKYQLLYAMDHPRHSTGKAWPMIVYRVILGLIVFQLTMAGWLALRQAYSRAGLIVPLLAFTVWTYWHYNHNYRPGNYHIALKSVREDVPPAAQTRHIDEEREEGQEFVNPNLVSALENVWLIGRIPDDVDV